MIDHAALNLHRDSDPGRRFAGWSDLLALATAENVAVKVSGLLEATEARTSGTAGARRRFLELLEAFGADRLMWGRTTPPSARVSTYREAMTFARDVTAELGQGERTNIFHGTAVRVLDLPW